MNLRFERAVKFGAVRVLCAMALMVGSAFAQEGKDAADGKPPVATGRQLPGIQPGGSTLLPSQWSLKPAGKHLKLGDFPVHIEQHPGSSFAAVLHNGYGEHEVVIVDLATLKIVSRVSVPQSFYGMTFSPAGDWLYVSGGDQEVVHRFAFSKGYLSEHQQLPVGKVTDKFVPGGISVDKAHSQLWVACPWGNTLCKVAVPAGKAEEAPAEAKHFALPEADAYPYATRISADEKQVFVSLWGKSGVAVFDVEKQAFKGVWPTQPHPTEMLLSPDGELLYVACANSNTVCVIDIDDGETREVIGSSLYPNAPVGSTPSSIALSPDGKVLLIANSDNNNLAIVDTSHPGKSHSLGFVPTGWYPTSVRFSEKGDKIYVTSGKGLASAANPQGPNPKAGDPPVTVRQYIGGLFTGTISAIDVPSPAQMAKFTKEAYACSPLRKDLQPVISAAEEGNPIPPNVVPLKGKEKEAVAALQAGAKQSPIKHCIYVIKENRTYDQVFGDMPEGHGDEDLCIFPEKITPNHHALAREFVLLDNFYVESEVSADGHEWTMAAYATDFVEKSWPLLYRGSRTGKLGYPAEGNFPIAQSAGGYLWDRCAAAGVTYRSYGEFIANGPKVGTPSTAKVKSLEGHFDPLYRGYDLDYPDVKRVQRYLDQLQEFEKSGEMPQLTIIRLPNDHTFGTSVGKPTPTAMVADNDLALGMLVEAVSKSKFWKETAIFVVEDDAQNGSDHVDAHRTVALVISPHTKRKSVDSTMYSTSSMLRTMELILGLEPMSQFDAAAKPMYNSFSATPDFTPYQHRPAGTDLEAKNLAGVFGADMSSKFDFSKEDAADDLLLNEVVWRSVRGANSKMPAPVRAGFVFASEMEDEDEEEEEDDD